VTDEHEGVQPSGVWATAVGVARVRALETERENALFRDPLAQAFAAAGGLWPSSPSLPDDEAARRRRLAVSFSVVIGRVARGAARCETPGRMPLWSHGPKARQEMWSWP
jgi:O-methyltransferase involved in polyketide biosynthesis